LGKRKGRKWRDGKFDGCFFQQFTKGYYTGGYLLISISIIEPQKVFGGREKIKMSTMCFSKELVFSISKN